MVALLAQMLVGVETVWIPTPGGVVLQAALVRPVGAVRGPAVVLLHGCGGPLPRRDAGWARELAERGHVVLLPDSFGSRGLGPQCRNRDNTIIPGGPRRQDAIAAAQWLAAQSGTPAGGVVLMGFSHGASTVLWTARQRPDLPEGLFRAFIAFYPGCRLPAQRADFRLGAHLLLLIGAEDNWTPAPPCQDFAARFPGQVDITVYPGAWHGFDVADQPMRDLRGVAFSADGSGLVRIGGNPAAAADARARVFAFLATQPAR